MANKYLNIVNRVVHLQRYRQILFVLLKHGFEDLLHRLRVDEYLRLGFKAFFKKTKRPRAKLISPVSIRQAMEELGPTFVKLGQMLTSRPDLLPADIILELTKLQDNVAPFDFEKVSLIVETSLGKSLEDLYRDFDPKPLAAGSIGQVHIAHLHSGEKVVVKIRRPGIKRSVQIDLDIMEHLAELMERQLELGQIQKPTRFVAEFRKSIFQELDYTIEAANMHRFQQELGENQEIYVPEVFSELCSDCVLTMAFVSGVKPKSAEVLASEGLCPEETAKRGASLMFQQVFINGFYHADPHPGNVLVLRDKRVCFLDFGMMGRLDRASRTWFTDIFVAVISKEEVKVADLLLRLTHGHNLVDRSALEREISEMIDHYLYQPLRNIKIGQLLGELFSLTTRHELQIPPQYFLLIKAVTQIEDLGCRLDPNFDLTTHLGPMLRKVFLRRYSIKRLFNDIYESGSDVLYLMREVPGELREILKLTKRGKMRMEFEHIGLEPLRHTLDRVSSRIASAIVLASLIVGSSLIVMAKIPPLWHDIPLIGLGGYLMSAIMGLMLLRSIYKDRNR